MLLFVCDECEIGLYWLVESISSVCVELFIKKIVYISWK